MTLVRLSWKSSRIQSSFQGRHLVDRDTGGLPVSELPSTLLWQQHPSIFAFIVYSTCTCQLLFRRSNSSIKTPPPSPLRLYPNLSAPAAKKFKLIQKLQNWSFSLVSHFHSHRYIISKPRGPVSFAQLYIYCPFCSPNSPLFSFYLSQRLRYHSSDVSVSQGCF